MKPRDYCCCAIPTVNSGIYSALCEQFIAALVAGILSVATPSIVGAVTPSFAAWLFAIVCFVAAAVQFFGFLGVAREKTTLFRSYVTVHSVLVLAVFAISAAWIILSATRHSTAQTNCTTNFFNATDTTQQDEAAVMCNVFPWVDVGVMAGLWALMAVMHVYLYSVLLSYSSILAQGIANYDSLKDSSNIIESIPMNAANAEWDNRPSMDGFVHHRQNSSASMSNVMSQPLRQPEYSYEGSAIPPAHTQDPAPTPQYSDSFYGGSNSNVVRPPQSQVHPGAS